MLSNRPHKMVASAASFPIPIKAVISTEVAALRCSGESCICTCSRTSQESQRRDAMERPASALASGLRKGPSSGRPFFSSLSSASYRRRLRTERNREEPPPTHPPKQSLRTQNAAAALNVKPPTLSSPRPGLPRSLLSACRINLFSRFGKYVQEPGRARGMFPVRVSILFVTRILGHLPHPPSVEISVDRGTHVQKISHFRHFFPRNAFRSILATGAVAVVTTRNRAISRKIALSSQSLP